MLRNIENSSLHSKCYENSTIKKEIIDDTTYHSFINEYNVMQPECYKNSTIKKEIIDDTTCDSSNSEYNSIQPGDIYYSKNNDQVGIEIIEIKQEYDSFDDFIYKSEITIENDNVKWISHKK